MENIDIISSISAVYGKFKNAGMVPHFHESYSVGVFTKGVYRYRSGTKEATIKAGETRVVAPYELHETYAGEWEYLHFDIEPSLLLNLVQDIEQNEKVNKPNIIPIHKQKPILHKGLKLYNSLKNREILEIEQNFSDFAVTLLQNSNSFQLISNISLDSVKLDTVH